MELNPRTTGDFIPEDRSWLASADGTQNPKSAVIAKALFTEGTHYPDGVLKSGTLLARCTSGTHSGKWGPYNVAATDGREVADGAKHLFDSTPIRSDSPAYIGVPLLRRGYIDESNLPSGHGVTSTAKTALKGVFSYE